MKSSRYCKYIDVVCRRLVVHLPFTHVETRDEERWKTLLLLLLLLSILFFTRSAFVSGVMRGLSVILSKF